MLNEFLALKEKYPDIVEKVDNFPARIKTAKSYNENELFVFIRKIRLFIKAYKFDKEKKEERTYEPLFEEIVDNIRCGYDEKMLDLSEKFWDAYYKLKTDKKEVYMPQSELSLEQRAFNNLHSLLSSHRELLKPYNSFLNTLLEDMNNYGTLPEFTLRKIANISVTNKKDRDEAENQLSSLLEELGENYLDIEKKKHTEMKKEIIIAVENIK